MNTAEEITNAIKALITELPDPDPKFGGSRWSAYELIQAIIDKAGGAYGAMVFAEDVHNRIVEHLPQGGYDDEPRRKAYEAMSDDDKWELTTGIADLIGGMDGIWDTVSEEMYDATITTLEERLKDMFDDEGKRR